MMNQMPIGFPIAFKLNHYPVLQKFSESFGAFADSITRHIGLFKIVVGIVNYQRNTIRIGKIPAEVIGHK